MLFLKIGLPSDQGKVWKRLARILTAIVMFIVMDQSIKLLMNSMDWEDSRMGALLAAFLITCVPLVGTVIISVRLKLYTIKS